MCVNTTAVAFPVNLYSRDFYQTCCLCFAKHQKIDDKKVVALAVISEGPYLSARAQALANGAV